MVKKRVTDGVYWVEIPEAELFVLCGCPADSVKHLMRAGLIKDRPRDGSASQTGPNAILLSDTTIQKGSFSNLAEFPVLQMLYMQGMILPGHPGNTGRKPMLIGLEDQVRSQALYIFRGTYGLASAEEIAQSGASERTAREMMRVKKWFAFDGIRSTEDLLDLRVVDAPAVPLRGGAFVRRRAFNVYEFIHGGESVTVDLNLGDGEEYPPTCRLDAQTVRREQFSVIHVGEGDGWDPGRPCMGSILCFDGRFYLLDAGPGIHHALTALGIGIREVAGIFHTHGHDDHFAGLTSLIRSDRRIPYYSSAQVRASVVKKYAALTGRNEATFYQYFEPHDLPLDAWTRVDGLEAMPVFSPHPVETNVFFFRARDENGVRSYAHLADIGSFGVLRKMVTEDPARNGMSRAAYDAVTRALLAPTTLKKVDVGGGLIHGQAEDFAADTSGMIFLSHTSGPLSEDQEKYGSCAPFGRQDPLSAAPADYLSRDAGAWLAACFPGAPAKERAVLEASPVQEYAPGEIILDAAALVDSVLLLLTGEVDVSDPRTGLQCRQGAGALVGELWCGRGVPARCTCRAHGHVTALRISCAAFTDFLRRTGMFDELGSVYDQRVILGVSWLFGEMLSLPLQVRVARAMEKRVVREDAEIRFEGKAEVLLLAQGLVSVFLGSLPIENLKPGDFCGEETLMRGARELPAGLWQRLPRRGHHLFAARALLDSTLYAIPAGVIEDIPVVQWKLMETYERRLKSIRSEIRFEWLDSYALGNGAVDEQHRSLFASIGAIASIAEGRAPSDKMGDALETLLALARSHLGFEESLAARRRPPGWDEAARGHEEFLRKVNGQSRQMESIPVAAMSTFVEYLKDWMMDHTLLEGRRFTDAFAP